MRSSRNARPLAELQPTAALAGDRALGYRAAAAEADGLPPPAHAPCRLDVGDAPEPGAADAQCRDGRLLVTEIRSDHYSLRPLGRDNYHIYDYALFYMNIRENVQVRVDAFLSAQH